MPVHRPSSGEWFIVSATARRSFSCGAFGYLGSAGHAGGLCGPREDELRNDLIFNDVLKALDAKRCPLVLTERRDHLEHLQRRFSRFVRNLVVLRGGMSAAERKASEVALHVSDDHERLILATGR